MKRTVVGDYRGIRIPAAWRGNCECGKWLVVPKSYARDRPLVCECGREWCVEGEEAVEVKG